MLVPVKDSVDIASGQTTSGILELGGKTPTHLFMPAAFTGTAITFEACSTKAGTFQALYDGAGSAVSVTVAQGEVISLGNFEQHLTGLRYLKLVSGSSEGAARTIVVAVRTRY